MPTAQERSSPARRGVIVGLDWWGVGPIEMAKSASAAGHAVEPFCVWSLTKRLHRRTIDMSVAKRWRLGRLEAFLEQARPDWILITSPHRLEPSVFERRANSRPRLVMLLGDDAVGVRAIPAGLSEIADVVAAPDAAWLEQFSAHKTITVPWGSTITEGDLLSAEPFVPRRVAMIGTAYAERVALAETMASRYELILQGSGWPTELGESVPFVDRIETLRMLRRRQAVVVNALHPQFRCGLNPQYYDFAAAAIPQVVVHPRAPEYLALRGPGGMQAERVPVDRLLDYAGVWTHAAECSALVRQRWLFPRLLEEMLAS